MASEFPSPLKVLILEDVATDAELMIDALKRGGLGVVASRVDTERDFIKEIEAFLPDVVLLDYSLPGYDGERALEHERHVHPEIPAVIVTGKLGDERAADLIKAGAKDYVLKNNLARLPAAVNRAILVEQGIRARKAVEAALAQSETRLRTILDTIGDGVIVVDHETGRCILSNPALCRMLGYSADELAEPGMTDIYLADALPEALVHYQQQGGLASDLLLKRKDGSVLFAEMTVSAVAINKRDYSIGVFRDVTERRKAEAKIREDEARFRSLVEQNVAGVVIMRGDGTVAYANPHFSKMTGYESTEIIGCSIAEFLPESERAAAAEKLISFATSDSSLVQLTSHIQMKGGRLLDVVVNVSATEYEGGPGFLAVVIDVTDQKTAETQAREAQQLYQQLFEVSRDAVMALEPPTWKFTAGNRAALEMFGIARTDDLTALCPWQLSPEVQPNGRPSSEESIARIECALRDGSNLFEWEHRRLNGEPFPTEVLLTRVRQGTKTSLYATVRDITERKRAEAMAAHAARHDALTGLANRVVFVEEVDQAIARSRRGEGFAVLYLDLDHFKDINDTLGHPTGDLVLQLVAERLHAITRKTDTVARFGGDEFAVIASRIKDPMDIAAIAEKVVQCLSDPFLIQGNEVRTGTSIGIAVYGPDTPDPETLLSHADVALYRAKSDGRGTYRFFTEAMNTEVCRRVTLGNEMRDAISSGQLFLVYQPQVDATGGRIIGLESLVRWRHPDGHLAMPGDFIPVAESSGLIVPLSRWVMREACGQMKRWIDESIAPPFVGVNISALQFKTPLEFERGLDAILDETRLSPDRVELELTESVLMEVSREHRNALARLRERGVHIAIDDFGSGYSSLDYLRRFPVDRLKIAQTFIRDLTSVSGNAAIVKAAISMAHELGILVVTEGVETEEQLRLVMSWGCRQVQGFYFSKPLTPDELHPALCAGVVSMAEGVAIGEQR